MKKYLAIILVGIVTVSIFMAGCSNDKSNAFDDPSMGKVIAQAAGVEDYTKMTDEDFDKVTHIEVGLPCFYSTMKDLKKCKNLETLVFSYNNPAGSSLGITQDYLYTVYDESKVVVETPERMEIIQQELKEIVESCPNLDSMYFYTYEIDEYRTTVKDSNGNVKQYLPLTSISFLDGRNMKALDLCFQNKVTDFDKVYDNTNLQALAVVGSTFGSLDKLSQLQNLDILRIDETLAEEALSYTNADIKTTE